jgi:hypothetical protein
MRMMDLAVYAGLGKWKRKPPARSSAGITPGRAQDFGPKSGAPINSP